MAEKSISDKKRPFWKLNKKEGAALLVFLALLLVGSALPGRLIVSTSPSLDHRVFFKVPVDPNLISKGDYYVFKLKNVAYQSSIHQGLKNNDILIKQVGCIPGEVLTKDAQQIFYCKQTQLGKALDKDSKGNILPVFTYTGPVPKDSYYMMGTNPRSFDSRYFGLIHSNELISKALPLW